MTYIASIKDMGKAFDHAHKALVASHSGEIGHAYHFTEMIEFWQKDYKVSDVIRNPGWGRWEYIVFPDEQAYTMFLMRWA